MIFVIIASFMPSVQEMIESGSGLVSSGEGGILLTLLFYGVPILLVIMALYAFLVALANR
jgi:hypothetical protein